MEVIGSAPPGKSLRRLTVEVAPARESVRDIVRALTGLNATHALEELEIDCSYLSWVERDEDPTVILWSLAAIPTLRHLNVEGFRANVVTPSDVAILEESVRSRRSSGNPLLSIRLGEFLWGQVAPFYPDYGGEECREFAQLLQRMRAVGLESELPTDELNGFFGNMDGVIERFLERAAWLERYYQGEEVD